MLKYDIPYCVSVQSNWNNSSQALNIWITILQATIP